MGYKETYEAWLSDPYFDDDTKAELRSIAGNDKEIEDRFYMDLERFDPEQFAKALFELDESTEMRTS